MIASAMIPSVMIKAAAVVIEALSNLPGDRATS
jgi:hypothetical protein